MLMNRTCLDQDCIMLCMNRHGNARMAGGREGLQKYRKNVKHGKERVEDFVETCVWMP